MENKKQSATRPKIGRKTGLLASNSQWRVIKGKNRQRGTFARHQLAPCSPWRVSKEKIGRSTGLLAMASEVAWEASKGG